MNMKDDLKGAMKARLGGGVAAPKAVESIFSVTTQPQVKAVNQSPASAAVEVKKKTKIVAESIKPVAMKNVTVPMPFELKDAIEKLTKEIDRNGLKKQERITDNSVIRSLISLIGVLDIDVSNIDSELSLKEAILIDSTRRGT